ncbi:MAG: hypothetical protein M3336_05590, partial [Chloroflexota bacterium]|nr:hypothetical protein [Chloroflexota bacterium]
LVPADFTLLGAPAREQQRTERALATLAPEPLIAMARPPGYDTSETLVPSDGALAEIEPDDPSALEGVHMPLASVAPFVLGVGFCIAMIGVITHPIVLFAGLAWMLAGAIGWIRIGLLEAQGSGHDAHGQGGGSHA